MRRHRVQEQIEHRLKLNEIIFEVVSITNILKTNNHSSLN